MSGSGVADGNQHRRSLTRSAAGVSKPTAASDACAGAAMAGRSHPGSAEMLQLTDATPVPCGHSVITAKRSDLFGWAGYGYCPSH